MTSTTKFQVGDRVQVYGHGSDKGDARTNRQFNLSTGVVTEVRADGYLVEHDPNTGRLGNGGGLGLWVDADLRAAK